MRGESSRTSATSYECERGGQKTKNTDRATEYAMTNIGESFLKTPVGWTYQPNNETFINFVKITSHSEDNDILSPKNLLKGLQKDFSLNAQDDENVEKVEPSPAFVAFAGAH